MGELSDGNSVEKKKKTGFFAGYKSLYAFSDSIDKQVGHRIDCLKKKIVSSLLYHGNDDNACKMKRRIHYSNGSSLQHLFR